MASLSVKNLIPAQVLGIHSFKKYLLMPYYVPDSVVRGRHSVVNQENLYPQETDILLGKTDNQQINILSACAVIKKRREAR